MIFECDIVHVCCRSRLGAWIEISVNGCSRTTKDCRSRLGAWIEINLPLSICLTIASLPFGSVD